MRRDPQVYREFILKETHKKCQDSKFTALSPVAKELLGLPGRMISPSKTLGPKGAIYNANLFNERAKRIWNGDIDIIHDRETLLDLADRLGTLYVLQEHKGQNLRGIPNMKYIQSAALVIIGTKMWIDDHFVLYMQHREKRKSTVLRSARSKSRSRTLS